MILGVNSECGSGLELAAGSAVSRIEPSPMLLPARIAWDGVRNPFGGVPVLISHSDAMGVAGCTFILRGTWVLMRRMLVAM